MPGSAYDAIVIGTGGVGSATLWHLARRGQRVLGLDPFPPGHQRGSSHGETRIIRMAYFEHSDYVPLLRRAYELWNELERGASDQLFHPTGIVELGPPEGVIIPKLLECSRRHQLAVEHLNATEVHNRYTGLFVPDHYEAVIEENAGYLLVEDCVRAHAEQAEAAGAVLEIGEPVRFWEIDGQGVRVTTAKDVYRADKMVVAAGPWAGQMLGPLDLRLEVRRKHLHWFHCDDPRYQEHHGFPAFFYELPEGYFYGFPQRDPRGVKVAEHSGGTVIDDPLKDDGKLEQSDYRRVREFLKTCLPYVSAVPTHHVVCFYTMSPDEQFIVDQHPEHPQILFAAGLSGHGFKFTSVLGEILADLATHARTDHPIDFLRLR